jgi:ankyrin repeat protein
MDESVYYMDELKNPNAQLYLYFKARGGSEGNKITDQFCKYFNDYSQKRALNLVYLSLQPDDGGQSITIGSKTYQSLKEVAGEKGVKQIKLIKNAVQEEDSLFLVWLSVQSGGFLTSTASYEQLPASDKFYLLDLLPFLSYKEFDSNWEKNAVCEMGALIHNNPGRFDLFEVYATQGLPFTGQIHIIDWRPTPIDYLSRFLNNITDEKTGLDLIRFLHEHGADVNELSGDGSFPLISAILQRNVPVVKLLLELGANPNVIFNGNALLLWAIFTLSDNDSVNEDNKIAIANLLLDYKVNVNVSDDIGRTPLRLSIFFESQNKVDLISRLLTARADVNKTDNDGVSPLMAGVDHYCNTTGNDKKKAALEVIELFLKKGAKTEILQKNGYWSPLMRTAYVNAIEAAEMLLKYGAKKEFVDKNSISAFVYAAEGKHKQMMDLLNPTQIMTTKKRLITAARILISTLAVLSVFLSMDVLARAMLTFHLSFPVLAGASFLLSHLLTAYILCAILGASGYLVNLRGTFNYAGSGFLYIFGIPIIFPLLVLPLQFLTRFLPENINTALALPAEVLTNLPNGIAMLAGFLALLAVIMTGAVFINKANDKLTRELGTIAANL